jgi:hypothetical protein
MSDREQHGKENPRKIVCGNQSALPSPRQLPTHEDCEVRPSDQPSNISLITVEQLALGRSLSASSDTNEVSSEHS